MQDPTATTSRGVLTGARHGATSAFRGIPFAAPPVGPRRFLPPAPPAPWTGERAATSFGAAPPQVPDALSGQLGLGFDVPIDEDCLTLNIVTPAADTAKRPVLVWLHGGAFATGSGSAQIYDPRRVVERGDAVVVTLNYRVGALGFLHLAPTLADPDGVQPNLGLLDQIEALRFVRDEIAAFGGDPERVTVFGESAGAGSIVSLLAMPRAKGLFQRAIIQSAAPDGMLSADEGATRARQFCEALGTASGTGATPDLAGLRAASIEALLEAQQACIAAGPHRTGMFFAPVIDGEVLPERPLDAIDAGAAADVDVLIGTTRNEMQLYALIPGMGDFPDEVLVPVVASRLSGDAPAREARAREAVRIYREHLAASGREPSQRELFFALESDLSLRVPATRLAESQSRHREATYMYLFGWESPFPDGQGGTLGSCHALDLPFTFGNLGSATAKAFVGEDPEARRLSDHLIDAWVAFARSGDPTHDGIGPWRNYCATNRTTMLLGRSCGPIDAPLELLRSAWDA